MSNEIELRQPINGSEFEPIDATVKPDDVDKELVTVREATDSEGVSSPNMTREVNKETRQFTDE